MNILKRILRRETPDPGPLLVTGEGIRPCSPAELHRALTIRPDTRFRPGQSGNRLGRPPSDPDARNLREARRIAARTYRESFTGGRLERQALAIADQIEAGKRDESTEVRSVLAGIVCGRGLAGKVEKEAGQ